MAAGDWVAGTHIELDRGFLVELSQGVSNVAEVSYWVIVPSGSRVYNGGRVDDQGRLIPFHYEATGPIPAGLTTLEDVINAGGLQLVTALAADEAAPVWLTASIVNPDGTVTPR